MTTVAKFPACAVKAPDDEAGGSMTAHLRCIVPFCRRTTRAGAFAEWICGPDWRRVPKHYRRAYLRAKRRFRNGQFISREVAVAVLDRLWDRCKRSAIEAAAGVG